MSMTYDLRSISIFNSLIQPKTNDCAVFNPKEFEKWQRQYLS
jgi:hypothetical protein